MNRIDQTFARLKSEGKKAFMPFVTACDPNARTSVKIVRVLEDAGADIVEVGFPYSDPLADGPTIQDSYARALGNGCSVRDAIGVVASVRKHSMMPIAAMVSYSIVWRVGVEAFAGAIACAGADALIVPDLPPEEAQALDAACRANSIGIVFLVTPMTPPERTRRIVQASRPFVYYVSVVGITGARRALPPELADGVAAVKAMTSTPVVVGFGVSTAAQARKVSGIADGVIVGSAIVKVVKDSLGRGESGILKAVRDFAAPIARAVKN